MTNYENLINLPLGFNANNHGNTNENNGTIALAEQLLNKMSQRDFSEVSALSCSPVGGGSLRPWGAANEVL